MFKKIFKFFILPTIIFFVLILVYSSIQKNIPISYWDEMLWVKRSYFFDFYIKRDFENKIWQSPDSYDSPKLTEYLYGAWLYRDYLKQKKSIKDLDYIKYLIKNGLLIPDESFNNSYSNYYNQRQSEITKFNQTDEGNVNYYLKKYGPKSLKTINLVIKARKINVFLLSGAIIIGYYIILSLTNSFLTSLIFSFLYGSNYLLVNSMLKAHTESMFVFLFNLSLLNLFLYFKNKKGLFLVLFAIFSGLCVSTKINGVILLIIFILFSFWQIIFKEKKGSRLKLFNLMIITVYIFLFVFYVLYPFIYINPIQKIIFIHKNRLDTAIKQAISSNSYLANPIIRIKQIFINFFHPNKFMHFQDIYFLNINKNYWIVFIFAFITGILSEIKKFVFMFIFVTTLIITGYYLLLNWPRHYVHLTLFFILYEAIGIALVIRLTKKMILFLIKNTFKRFLKHRFYQSD